MMMVLLLVSTFLFAEEPTFPACENAFESVEVAMKKSPHATESVRKLVYQTYNAKKMEVTRFVRQQKEDFRKSKEKELKDLATKYKASPTKDASEKERRREERKALVQTQSEQKKDHSNKIEEQEKNCLAFLSGKRQSYLDQLKQHQKEHKEAMSVPNPAIEEFKEIPKGPGTVLKPM
jgi:hypothetical protein